MMSLVQLIVGFLAAVSTLVFLYLLATSEMSFMDLKFAAYFGAFSTIAAISFFVLTRNNDNEETDPLKEKLKK